MTQIFCVPRLSDPSITPDKGRFIIKRRNKLISPIKSLRNIRQNTKEKGGGKSKLHKRTGSPIPSGSSEDPVKPHEHAEGIANCFCPLQK